MKARQRVGAVVERWFLVEPLLFAVWTTHDLVLEPRVKTIRVGRGRIEYNPSFIEELSKSQLEAVLRCEATRILLKHPYQRRKECRSVAYLASNVTLQEFLKTELPLPSAQDIFGSRDHDRLYFEFYYYKLLEQAGAVPGPSRAEGRLLDLYADAASVGIENTEGWDVDDLQRERIDNQIRTALESGGWGTVAGNLRDRILAGLRPALDYRAVLAQFRASVLSNQRVLTRMKPSRRYGFECMGSRYDFTTRLLVAVDVSGSMTNTDLANGFAVINAFFRQGIRQIDVVQFDAKIQGQICSLTRARAAFEVKGRGGTNFNPIMELIDEHRDYDGLLVFTDGLAPVPPAPRNRRTRVLWLFNSMASYQRMFQGLRAIGPAAYLQES